MARITKREVDKLSAADKKPVILWDESLSGFGVKALPSGVKRYIVKYRTNGGGRLASQKWLTLGTHGHITPDQARTMAQQALAAVARGEDPQSDKQQRRTAPSMDELWARFDREELPQNKLTTRYDYTNHWTNQLQPRFGKVKVEALSRVEIESFHRSMQATPYAANRALALLSRLMSLAEKWGWRAQNTNPCKLIARFSEEARNRYLSLGELNNLALAISELLEESEITPAAANAIELLLFTGARLNEILGARWDWVDRDRQTLCLPDSKTGKRVVYLSAQALDVLAKQAQLRTDSVYIFPSREDDKHFKSLRKPWGKVIDRAGLDGVRLHDLRHTAGSIAVNLGASLPIIGKLLGHSQPKTTQRYAHVDIDPALKAANDIGAAIAEAFKRKE
jgi:integrase